MKTIEKHYQNNKKQINICFLFTIIFSLIAHAFGLLNNIFSHDALNALYADSTENQWKIALGRFLVPIIRAITRGPLALPWLIGILGIVYIFFSSYLIIKIFRIQSSIVTILVPAIMVTNVSVTATIATYIYEFDIDMLALLFSIIAVYIWKQKNNAAYFIFSALFIIFSECIYQSFVCVAATLMVCILIFSLLNGECFKNVFKKAVVGVAELGISSVLYYVLSKVFISLFDIETALRTDALNVSDSLTMEVSLINSINATVFYEIKKILHPASVYPAILMGAINILLIALAGLLILKKIIKLGKNKTPEKVLAVLLVAMLPFAAGFIGILTKGEIHDLMIFAFWIIYVFIFAVISKYSENKNQKINSAIRILCIVLASAVIWNNILIANTAYLKKDLDQKAAVTAMTRIVSDLEERDDYTVGQTKLFFVGSDFTSSDLPGFESVESIEGMEYSTIGISQKSWYYNSYDKFFTYFMNYPAITVDRSFITPEIHDSIMDMPAFPSDGYIQKYGDVLVVKVNN